MTGDDYVVVEFTETADVGTVRRSWIKVEGSDKICFWPEKNPRKRLLDNESPNESWEKWQIRELFSCNDLKKALRKEKAAQCTSELTSDEEELGKGRRQKKRVIVSDDSSDSDIQSDLSTPKKKAPKKKLCYLPTQPMKSKNKENTLIISEGHPKNNTPLSEIFPTPTRPVERSQHHSCDELKNEVAYLKGQLETIKKLCVQTKFEVRQCSEMLSTVLNNKADTTTEPTMEVEALAEFETKFPLKHIEAVDMLETGLKNEESTMKKMSEFCKRIGGETIEIQVKRSMVRIFSTEVAVLFSWEGKKQKRRMKDLAIIKIIEKSISTGNLAGLFTHDAFEKKAKEWVRQSSTRLAQRAKNPNV